jgi:hypothetical protein
MSAVTPDYLRKLARRSPKRPKARTRATRISA